jgi:hypothetical protein
MTGRVGAADRGSTAPNGNQRFGQIRGVHCRELLSTVAKDRRDPQPGEPEDFQDLPISRAVDDGRPHD